MSHRYTGLLKSLKITYERERGVSAMNCEVLLEASGDSPGPTSLRFFGVREMEFRQSIFSVSLVGLSIVDISDRQLEGLRYEVFDEEDQTISFSAGHFELSQESEREQPGRA